MKPPAEYCTTNRM